MLNKVILLGLLWVVTCSTAQTVQTQNVPAQSVSNLSVAVGDELENSKLFYRYPDEASYPNLISTAWLVLSQRQPETKPVLQIFAGTGQVDEGSPLKAVPTLQVVAAVGHADEEPHPIANSQPPLQKTLVAPFVVASTPAYIATQANTMVAAPMSTVAVTTAAPTTLVIQPTPTPTPTAAAVTPTLTVATATSVPTLSAPPIIVVTPTPTAPVVVANVQTAAPLIEAAVGTLRPANLVTATINLVAADPASKLLYQLEEAPLSLPTISSVSITLPPTVAITIAPPPPPTPTAPLPTTAPAPPATTAPPPPPATIPPLPPVYQVGVIDQGDRNQYLSDAQYQRWHGNVCSAATMASVMIAYGYPTKLGDVLNLMRDDGTISTWLGLADNNGFEPLAHHFSLQAHTDRNSDLDAHFNTIMAQLKAHQPVIINLWDAALYPTGHFVVAFNVNSEGYVGIMNPDWHGKYPPGLQAWTQDQLKTLFSRTKLSISFSR